MAAPTTAIDDIAEKFGRPRAHSFSRQDRHTSLPALDEEGDGLSSNGFMDDRRRAVSMSAVDEPRWWRPSREVTTDDETEEISVQRTVICSTSPHHTAPHRTVDLLTCHVPCCRVRYRCTAFFTVACHTYLLVVLPLFASQQVPSITILDPRLHGGVDAPFLPTDLIRLLLAPPVLLGSRRWRAVPRLPLISMLRGEGRASELLPRTQGALSGLIMCPFIAREWSFFWWQ